MALSRMISPTTCRSMVADLARQGRQARQKCVCNCGEGGRVYGAAVVQTLMSFRCFVTEVLLSQDAHFTEKSKKNGAMCAHGRDRVQSIKSFLLLLLISGCWETCTFALNFF